MEKIGRIKYTSKGEYSPDATYTPMNTVLFEGSRWECLKETTGNPPPDRVKNEDGSIAGNEFWRLFLPGALGDDYVKKTDIAVAPTETEPGKAGVNYPDGKTIQIDENGMMTGTPLDFMGTWKELQEGIKSGEITDGMVGYIEGTKSDTEDSDHPNNMLIDIDDYLSLVSSNAVQNRIITAAINEIKSMRATLETYGMSKICPIDVTDVTEDNGLVLGAVEKNASVDGTLKHDISILHEKAINIKTKQYEVSCTNRDDIINSFKGQLNIAADYPANVVCAFAAYVINADYLSNSGNASVYGGILYVNNTVSAGRMVVGVVWIYK